MKISVFSVSPHAYVHQTARVCVCVCVYSCFSTARRVAVPDERYDFLCQHHKPASKVPAFLHVVDIAGLVKGAHEGQVCVCVCVCVCV